MSLHWININYLSGFHAFLWNEKVNLCDILLCKADCNIVSYVAVRVGVSVYISPV